MIDDIYTAGIASGWKVSDASTLKQNLTLEADVVIVGTGAGGGTAAEILSQAGLKVLMLEEGPLKTAADFKDMDEARAYADLYQEAAGRATSDGAIGILQGRAVGGTTTVNWTSSFRTPAGTLKHWAQAHGVQGLSEADLAPWFEKMEARLGIAPWGMAANANNAALKIAADKLGWESHIIPRNVRGCWDSGYCGLGCPVNAKQSMLVSTIPEALKNGAQLIHRLRVQRVLFEKERVTGLVAHALDAAGVKATGIEVQVRARHYVLAGGAINTPALLLRSGAPDPHRQVGKRTCIHPVNMTVAQMPAPVNGWYGAPQSVASDEFQWKPDARLAPGFKLEAAPTYPGLSTTIFMRHGKNLMADMGQLANTQAMLALVRDGFHDDSPGGEVRIDGAGNPILDYDLSDYLWAGLRNAYLRMAEAQFAAGAQRVMPAHLDGQWCDRWTQAREHIEGLRYAKFKVSLFTAHLMGGCAMGGDEKTSVTDSDGGYRRVDNLSIFDGSLFPTSIGANPQLSIYGLIARNASKLATRLGLKTAA
ncbi:MAG: GMC family oxidoreductase [Pseudomonadota bacterium]